MKPGDTIGGRFVVERLAGTGSMGAVYRGRDAASGRPVAVKVLHDPESGAARFEREAEILASLDHSHIVRYVAHGRVEGPERSGYLVLEWLDGFDLGTRLLDGRLDIAEAITLTRSVASALAAAHARGVLHRDVKPSNIFLEGGSIDRVKVLDFGVARVARSSARTRTGAAIGTPGYMAPEQARGDPSVDARADVFALGCVAFECLTGRHAFAGENVMAVLAKVLLEDPPRASAMRARVPPALDDLVARMLAKSPAGRPADGAAALREIEAINVASLAVSMTVPETLTTGEQRVISVVIVGRGSEPDDAQPFDATITREEALAEEALARSARGPAERIAAELGHFGATVEPLRDGSIAATIAGFGGASDQAARAARFALALRALFPDLPMALATGRGASGPDRVTSRGLSVGEAIDRAARLITAGDGPVHGGGSGSPIRIDNVTAGLLDPRFEVSGDARGLVLLSERERAEATRTLLGRETPCVGRERELRRLLDVFDECVSEPVARVVLVTSPAGAGKSRLRYELVRAIKARGEPVEIWNGRGDPMRAGAPFALIAPAIRRAAGIYDGEPIEVRRQKLLARAGRNLAGAEARRAAEFLGELIGAPFPDEGSVELRAARRDAMLMGDQMRRAFEAFLRAECSAAPLAFVIDNLEWGDRPSIDFLDAALRALDSAPFLVLALGRPEVRDVFPRIWEERALIDMRLGELSKKASEKLVRAVLGDGAPAEVVATIVTQAAGNAFFLEELVRAVAEGDTRLPDTVLAMVESRLERLGPGARRALRAGTVFGQVFWRGGVAALLGGTAIEIDQAIAELAATETIEQRATARFPGEAEYVVRQAVVREAAYAMLTDADRALGHRLAAAWLERAGEGDSLVLAEHLDRGGEPARAASHYARAAAQALEGNDFSAAVERAERGVRAGASGRELPRLRLIQVEAMRWLGDNAGAARAAAEAMEQLTEGEGAWCIAAAERGNALGRLGDAAALADLAERVLAAPIERARLDDRAALGIMIAQLIYAGRYESVTALLDRIGGGESFPAEGVDLPGIDPRTVAILCQARGAWATWRGDAISYRIETERSALAAERAGDLRLACQQRVNLGDAYLVLGGYAEAERVLAATAAAAERMGLAVVQAVARVNLGCAIGCQGRLDEARGVLDAVERSPGARAYRRAWLGARIYLSLAHAIAGDAEGSARHATAVLDEMPPPPLRAFALGLLARAEITGGAIDVGRDSASAGRSIALASEHAGQAHRILMQLGRIDAGEAIVRLAYAEALFASGAEDEGRAAIRVARDRLFERAERLTDPAWKQSFLGNVRENAETLRIAAEKLDR